MGPPTQAVCTASRTTPQPAFDVYFVPSTGVFPGAPVTINYVNCVLDVATILSQQGSTGSFPGDTLATKTPFVTKWYNYGTAGHCVQTTNANMPVLAVLDNGTAHLVFGTDDGSVGGNNRYLVCPVTPQVNNQLVALTAQNYGAEQDNAAASERVLFYTSSTTDVFGVGLMGHSTSNDGSRPTAEGTQYRLYNPSLFPGFPVGAEQPTGILGANNAVAITSNSNSTNLKVRVGSDSYTNTSFAPFSNLGTGLRIGMGADGTSTPFQGYIDNFYFIDSAQNDTFQQTMITQLSALLPTYNTAVNVVLDGASIPSGMNAIGPSLGLVGNCQGLSSYGFMQALMGGASARWTNLATQGSGLVANIIPRMPYVYALYQPSAARNLYVVNYILGSGAEPATLASTFFASVPVGQTWTVIVIGTGNPLGDATTASRNATAKAAGTATPTPGGPGYWFVDGLSKATWDASSFTSAQKFACDSIHVSPIGATLFRDDSLPGLLAAFP